LQNAVWNASGLGGVDKLHVQGVSQHEGNVVFGTAVGQPVPAKHALDTDDEVVPEGREGLEHAVEVAGELFVGDHATGLIENAQLKSSAVQINASVESVLAGVEAHGGLPG
jgi:hypothetical protein